MTFAPPPLNSFVAVIVITIAALIFRAWLQLELLADGFHKDYAADLSYLVVPPTLLILLLPIWRQYISFIGNLFRRDVLTPTLILNAFAVGCLLRVAAWSQLIAGVAFGWYYNPDPTALIGPAFVFNCAAPKVIALGIVVMVILVPFVEELVSRGLIQSWLSHRGAVISIGLSALFFMLWHRPSSWGFAFFAGLVLGVQYWRTGALWSSLISHATVNALILWDWRCLNVRWNPRTSDLPVLYAGIPALVALVAAITVIIFLLTKTPGRPAAPAERVTER